MNGRFNRLALGLAVLACFASSASADDPIAETVRKWGLLGPWSLDCSLPPDHGNGTVLAYEIGADGGVLYRRDFGDVSDENQVLAAEVSAEGLLNLEVYFPAIKQKREYGLEMLSDGSLRAIFNRSEKGEYSIKDGKFVATSLRSIDASEHEANGGSHGRKRAGKRHPLYRKRSRVATRKLNRRSEISCTFLQFLRNVPPRCRV